MLSVQWVNDHWSSIVALSGALWTLLSVINGLVKDPVAKSVLGKMIDGLSFLSRASAPGTVKAPLTGSKPIAERAATPEGDDPFRAAAPRCPTCGQPAPSFPRPTPEVLP